MLLKTKGDSWKEVNTDLPWTKTLNLIDLNEYWAFTQKPLWIKAKIMPQQLS